MTTSAKAASTDQGIPKPQGARDTQAVTPMMAQYMEIKSANPDMLLFYRMGDFYELFFEDAEVASRALGITLTTRGKHQGADIPMCGVPVHAAEEYLRKLIALGHRVAVCEQTEDPAEARKRGSKAVVRRDVVRLVTPGTITEEKLLEPARANHLAAVAILPADTDGSTPSMALAWCDLSTGSFAMRATTRRNLGADLARIEPSELLVSVSRAGDLAGFAADMPAMALTELEANHFDSEAGRLVLEERFGKSILPDQANLDRSLAAAAGALLAYLAKTQKSAMVMLEPPVLEQAARSMVIDAPTRTSLELVRTLAGDRQGSLLTAIDRTLTGLGGRLLADRIVNPLIDPAEISSRLDSVSFLVEERNLAERLKPLLRSAPDMPRAMSRLALSRGGPRDLLALKDGLRLAAELAAMLGASTLPDELAETRIALSDAPHAFGEKLSAALADDVPLMARDGGFLRTGFDAELDRLRALRDESRRVIASLEREYAEETGIKSLKIRFNNVLGYFVEVTQNHAATLTEGEAKGRFVHRQTMANAMRFTTAKLAELESDIANAAGQALAIELEWFETLRTEALTLAPAISGASRAIAILDVSRSNAELALEMDYCRPKVDDSLSFSVVSGRHPVVEQALAREGMDPFVANDCDLGSEDSRTGAGAVWLLTGPNMGGKSTFLRQNALIAILAQSGAYVPAETAHLGVVDRLFSRVGAADDLARGRSTFMVEMVETASILNLAGNRALVILDEIGRGTATFDGLSIAWATTEYLHEHNRCRALFATHYHELTALSEKLDRLVNMTMRVREWRGDVVFLHEVGPGAADRSYGIQVAKLAGLPDPVVERARSVLDQLEKQERTSPAARLVDDLPLFSVTQQVARQLPEALGQLLEVLEGLTPDDMTPRQAHEKLYELRAMARDTNKRQ